jgi:hypothetical protein
VQTLRQDISPSSRRSYIMQMETGGNSYRNVPSLSIRRGSWG